MHVFVITTLDDHLLPAAIMTNPKKLMSLHKKELVILALHNFQFFLRLYKSMLLFCPAR